VIDGLINFKNKHSFGKC